MISHINDLKKFLNDKCFQKIFILCGNNSFRISGAEKFLSEFIKKKKLKFFIRNLNFQF